MLSLLHLAATVASSSPICPGGCGLPQTPSAQGLGALNNVLGITFGIVGALALLMMTLSGLRYVTSAGDPQKAAKARDGIIYAAVGIAIAITAEAIIAFIGKGLGGL